MKFFNKKNIVKNKNSQQKSNGFMIVELLVAASIITLAILSFMAVAQKSIYVSRQALHTMQASSLLEEGAEMVRMHRDNAWSNISGLTVGTNYYPVFSGSTLTFPATASSVGIFTRKVVFANVNRDNTTGDIVSSGGTLDAGTKLVTVTVSWYEGSNLLSKSLSFYISDIFS